MRIITSNIPIHTNQNPAVSTSISFVQTTDIYIAQGTLSFWSKAMILDSSEAGYHTFTLTAALKKNGTVDLEHVALEVHRGTGTSILFVCLYLFIDHMYIISDNSKVFFWFSTSN